MTSSFLHWYIVLIVIQLISMHKIFITPRYSCEDIKMIKFPY